MIVSIEIELQPGQWIRATADVTPSDGVAGPLAVEGYPVIVCASWGTPVALDRGTELYVEGEIVDAAERQIESLA